MPTDIVYDRATARPAPYRGLTSELFRVLCRLYLWLSGWKMEGDWPSDPQCVVIAAPHTSNWDGFNMVAAAGYYRFKLRWMGKASLAEGPFGWLVRWAGIVPIDRSRRNDVVGAMVEAFARTKKLILAVPPEGTRREVREWKTGFYQIALHAGVPIIISVLDYGSSTIRISGKIIPSGDYATDLAIIQRHYIGVKGKIDGRFVAGG